MACTGDILSCGCWWFAVVLRLLDDVIALKCGAVAGLSLKIYLGLVIGSWWWLWRADALLGMSDYCLIVAGNLVVADEANEYCG